MKRISLILFVPAFIAFGAFVREPSAPTANGKVLQTKRPQYQADGLKRAKALVRVINQYRQEQGLEEIPYSPQLTLVARWHVYDLEVNNPSDELENDNPRCNLHSWSDKGHIKHFFMNNVVWSPCCRKEGLKSECGWNKPREISKGVYKGNGYEIAAANSGKITNYEALKSWKGSPGHHNMILNRGTWAKTKWKAIGAAISSHYAVVWFGKETDTSSDSENN